MSDLIKDFFKVDKNYVPSEQAKILKDRIMHGAAFSTTDENGKLKHIPYEQGMKIKNEDEKWTGEEIIMSYVELSKKFKKESK
jgi:hypothetical protein